MIELSCKSGIQDTFMHLDIYHGMNYVANLVNRVLLCTKTYIPRNELCSKSGKQGTVMYHGVCDVTSLGHVVHRGIL